MEIKTKFKLGETVYPILKANSRVREKCPTCDGSGIINYKGAIYNCPNNCDHGIVYKIQKEETIVGNPFVIKSIDIRVNKNGTNILYINGELGGNCYDEDILFSTKEEALNKCKEL